MSLTKSQLKKISTIFSSEKDLKKASWKVRESSAFKDWEIPSDQLLYISAVLSSFDNDIDKVNEKFEKDNYYEKLKPFKKANTAKLKKPSGKTIPSKKVEEKSQLTGMNVMQDFSLANIRDYKIIKGMVTEDLERQVREEMKRGWIPYGGVGIDRAGMGGIALGQMTYFQVMIKRGK